MEEEEEEDEDSPGTLVECISCIISIASREL